MAISIILQWTIYTYAAFMLLTSLRPHLEKFVWQPRALVESLSSIETKDFSWTDITPKKHLEYHPCFNDHFCTRLDVPMDWNATEGDVDHRVAVAIIKYPAKVPVTDPRYGGAIFLNPGGPGGSGVSLVFRYGKSIQTIVDAPEDPTTEMNPWSSNSKYFDIISFDPRGINNTTPQVVCFPSTFNRQAFELQKAGEGLVDSSDSSFEINYARSNAVGVGCADRIGLNATGGPGIGGFVTTANVVADMVEMIEQHGAWREAEAKRLLSETSPERDLRRSLTKADAILENSRWQKGSEKLLYWGFSYGTVLGATFAAMQPDRAGRMAIDGVCDSEDYYSGRWLSNLLEADAIFSRFFDYCHTAGREKCAFMQKGDSKEDLHARFDTLVANIKVSPVFVPASADGKYGPDIIKYDDIRKLAFTALYSPLNYYTVVAEGLADLVKGNGTLISIRKSDPFQPFCPSGQCGEQPTPYSAKCQLPASNDEVATSIMCSDGDEMDRTIDDFKAIGLKTREQSEMFGDIWTSSIHAGCTGWKIRAKWRFTGPFVANTSHPLLWLGNTGDPVTPVVNAHKMAKGFPSSVVLTQDSDGHCTLSAPSLCTAKYVRAYFQNGSLPAVGTICHPSELPFIGNVTEPGMRGMNEEDEVLLNAMRNAPTIKGFLSGL